MNDYLQGNKDALIAAMRYLQTLKPLHLDYLTEGGKTRFRLCEQMELWCLDKIAEIDDKAKVYDNSQ